MRIVCSVCLLIGALALGACGGNAAPVAAPVVEIPVTLSASGDPAKGEGVFQTSGCTACHYPTTEQLVGPGLMGALQPAGPKRPEGVDYGPNKLPNGQDRSEENIAAWIRSGGQGKIGVMTPQTVSDQDMVHLLAYLRSLKRQD